MLHVTSCVFVCGSGCSATHDSRRLTLYLFTAERRKREIERESDNCVCVSEEGM